MAHWPPSTVDMLPDHRSPCSKLGFTCISPAQMPFLSDVTAAKNVSCLYAFKELPKLWQQFPPQFIQFAVTNET